MNTVIVICFAGLYYTLSFYLLRHLKITTRDLCLCGIVIAMTLVLESIRIPLPTGATISLCSPVPLMLLAVLIDYRLAIVSGWICGVLSMLMVPGWQLVVLCGTHGLFLLPRICGHLWHRKKTQNNLRYVSGFLHKNRRSYSKWRSVLFSKRLGWLGSVGIQFTL